MTESAYVRPPWLIDRDGVGYLQVSPLLYRIAELCDGKTPHEEIARRITEGGEPVQPQTVERLITAMLVPAGVVVGPDGEVATPAARPRSPLSLAGRMKMLGPGAIEPLTGVLKQLYRPPLIAVVVLLSVASRAWLYFSHGLAGPAHDALYHPFDLLILMVLLVLSAGFHEFGHAAALGYGGGRVRGMGVGLYLIYPAVYTDVTENYHLPRGARIRTDLGGFYFNLIFSLAVLAVALLTNHQFLLVFLLLTDIEILQQTLPFARFDGYWALADLTGIPDFFTHMAIFWRRILRLPMPQLAQSPELKPWGRAILAAYSVVTVPVLLTFLFLTVAALPRVLATAWDSGLKQLAAGQLAWSDHQPFGILLAVIQLLVLAFPAVAACYLLARTFQQFEASLWRWAEGSNRRRAVAATATLAVVGGCGFLWAPALPGGRPGPASVNLKPIGGQEGGTIFDLAATGAASLLYSAHAAPVTGPQPLTGGPVASPSPAGGASPSPAPDSPQPSPSATATASQPSPSPSP